MHGAGMTMLPVVVVEMRGYFTRGSKISAKIDAVGVEFSGDCTEIGFNP